MLAQDLISSLESRGFVLSLVESDSGPSIAVDSSEGAQLTEHDRLYLKSYRTELINSLRTPAPTETGERNPEPRIENGSLIVPLNAPARFRWWAGGQSVVATLAELDAPLTVWANYAARSEDLLSDRHSGRCSSAVQSGAGFVFCVECGYYCETEGRAA